MFSFHDVFFHPVLCSTNSSCLVLPGLSVLCLQLKDVNMFYLVYTLCSGSWMLSQGSKRGRLYGSLPLFPISLGSVSLINDVQCLKTTISYVVCFCLLVVSTRKINPVPIISFWLLFHFGWKWKSGGHTF